ncbi:MAG: hypothetical protein ACYDC3_12675 [Candidatus Binataceae bacterium]
MLETLSRTYVKLKCCGNENYAAGILSETHLLLSRLTIRTRIDRNQNTTGAFPACANAGTGQTYTSTKNIPRHAQRLFLLDHQPAQFPQPPAQSTQPKRRLDGAGARQGGPNQDKLRPPQPVRRFQANGSRIAQLTLPDLARAHCWSNVERSIN